MSGARKSCGLFDPCPVTDSLSLLYLIRPTRCVICICSHEPRLLFLTFCQVVLAILLSEFRFRLAEPTVSQIAIDADGALFQLAGILKPRDGMWMHAEPRMPAARL